MPRPRSFDRDAALGRAVDAFWATGYLGTSMRALLAVTRVPPASLYAEFGGKAGLFLVAVERYIEGSRREYERTLCAGAPGLAVLRRHLDARACGGDPRGCLLVNALAERSEVPPDALARAFFSWVRGQYARHLHAAQKGGELRAGAEPEALALALLALDQGLALAGKLPVERARLSEAVRALFDAVAA